MRSKINFAVTVLAAASVGLAACSSSASNSSRSSSRVDHPASSSPGSLVVGSAGFPESELLADIYADALSARGVQITKKLNIGERSVYFKALQDGSITFFPEYNGSLLYYLDPKATAKSTADVDTAIIKALGTKLTALKSAVAQDTDTITVSRVTAARYHLVSIGDLASVAGNLTVGGPAAFKSRPDGLPALKSAYNVTFGKFVATSAGGTVTVTSLKNGTIDAADIFSTDPSIAANNFVALNDPKNMFAAQNITPIVANAHNNPTITSTANAVSAKLDTRTLARLLGNVSGGQSADEVARAWLASVGLGAGQ